MLYRFAIGRLLAGVARLGRAARRPRARALGVLRALRPVDVQVGAIQGFNHVHERDARPAHLHRGARARRRSCPTTTTTGTRAP